MYPTLHPFDCGVGIGSECFGPPFSLLYTMLNVKQTCNDYRKKMIYRFLQQKVILCFYGNAEGMWSFLQQKLRVLESIESNWVSLKTVLLVLAQIAFRM